MAYKEQKFITQVVKTGKSKIKTLAGLVSNESLISVNVCLLAVSLVAEKAKQQGAEQSRAEVIRPVKESEIFPALFSFGNCIFK